MTKKDKCAVVMLAYTFIDSATQIGLKSFNDTLQSLALSFEDFNDYMMQVPKDPNFRFSVYEQLRSLSSEDKGTVRSILFNAYSNGGKQGTEYAAYYFKEMLIQCDLANSIINL